MPGKVITICEKSTFIVHFIKNNCQKVFDDGKIMVFVIRLKSFIPTYLPTYLPMSFSSLCTYLVGLLFRLFTNLNLHVCNTLLVASTLFF
jgi:hypothetical protein